MQGQRPGVFIIRHSHAGTPAPGTLRRLTRTIIEYQHGRLAGDATIMLIERLPGHLQQMTPH